MSEKTKDPRAKKPYAPPKTRESVAVPRSAVLLECTGQFNCGIHGYDGCCQPDEGSCFVNC
ncbi:MAG: hypothetical protein AMXMBFR34_25100 [Myxococcaceae bacterium]